VAGLATALRCVRALRAPGAGAERLREIAATAAAARAGRAGGASGNGWISEAEAKRALRDFGVPVPDGRVASDPDDAAAAARELGWPVALKLSGGQLRHKSEAGALALDVVGDEDVEAESRRLLALPEAADAELLVERMADPGVELLVAAMTDGVVPALVVGLGGIWTEVLGDVAIIPLPAEPERIERALRSLRGAPALTGGRGHDPVDLEAVANVAAGAGRMLLAAGLSLLELNPVVARPDGAVALDAVAARRS
jgi:acyl-CoA synthetase (NDP forming)